MAQDGLRWYLLIEYHGIIAKLNSTKGILDHRLPDLLPDHLQPVWIADIKKLNLWKHDWNERGNTIG